MALEDVLAGIGGGIRGGLDMYSWQQEQNEGRRRFDVGTDLDRQGLDLQRNEYQLRRKKLLAELEEMARAVASKKADQRAKEDKARSDAKLRERAIAELPPHLQGPARAKTAGLDFTAKDFEAPKTPEQRAAEEAAALTRIEAEAAARARGTHRGQPPITPKDDATFPLDVQAEVVRLRTQHPTFDAASQALAGTLDEWRQRFPRLSPQKALDALRQAYTGAGGSNALDGIISGALSGGAAGRGTPGAGARPPAGAPPITPSGRGVGASPITPSGRGVGAGLDDAALRAAAKAVLEENGFSATPENIDLFLSKPANRQRLQAGGGR